MLISIRALQPEYSTSVTICGKLVIFAMGDGLFAVNDWFGVGKIPYEFDNCPSVLHCWAQHRANL